LADIVEGPGPNARPSYDLATWPEPSNPTRLPHMTTQHPNIVLIVTDQRASAMANRSSPANRTKPSCLEKDPKLLGEMWAGE
jgi:hypothetical protein